MEKGKACIVLLSGGQDSTTCLYWAKEHFEKVIALGFYYGQKHKIEQVQAKKIAFEAGVELITLNVVGLLGGSSLVDYSKDHNNSHDQNKDLPASFTAGRNLLFLTLAASTAFNMGITDIVTGVCQTDYSGYPDCRQTFIDSMQVALSKGMFPEYDVDIAPGYGVGFLIHTPLMYLTKAETWKMSKELGCLEVIINDTMTDYNGDTTKNEWGMGINNNPATAIRVKGYYEAKEKGWI